MIVGDLWTQLDLRREPMLPADTEIDIARLHAGPLPFHVVIKLGAEGDVVQGREFVIEISDGSDDTRGAAHLRGRALREVRRVEIEAIRRSKRVAAIGD